VYAVIELASAPRMTITEKAREMFTHFCSVLIDGLFLCLWAAVNFGVNVALSSFHLEGSDAIIATVLQVLFGIATLVPNAIFIYRDIRVMWIRANKTIAEAAQE
jgi:drug/metabolite transporter (DMT)-like permease